jgi:hypothetical protein
MGILAEVESGSFSNGFEQRRRERSVVLHTQCWEHCTNTDGAVFDEPRLSRLLPPAHDSISSARLGMLRPQTIIPYSLAANGSKQGDSFPLNGHAASSVFPGTLYA